MSFPMRIVISPRFLSANNVVWSFPPTMDAVYATFGCGAGRHRADYEHNRKVFARALLLDDGGLEIREDVEKREVNSFQFFFITDRTKRNHPKSPFRGEININGATLRFPLKVADFPASGEFVFKQRIAVNGVLSVMYTTRMEFIESLIVSYRTTENSG